MANKKIGILTIAEAMESAKSAFLDLVQVSSSDVNPVVCKLLDYGKHLFDKKKSNSSSWDFKFQFSIKLKILNTLNTHQT